MTMLSDRATDAAAAEKLKPYVPRLLVEWMREQPDARHLALDGSLVFVDISGFTALTERLARQGKIGAELMRDTLDGVFTALLDEAYDWGAGLLKWGGDALLLLFDAPGHPARAARACWEMQRTLDRVGRLRVPGGTVTLRMSVGITTGRLDFFIAGSVHRELLVAGASVTEMLSIEAVADAGEIGISRALAALLDSSVVGPSKEEALLLVAPPEADRDRAPDVGSVDGVDVASCIPVAARAHVLLDRSEPEHRTITAAFIDLMDTDELLERLGPDAFATALDERLSSIQEAAARFEVPFYETDVGKSSVKALLTAGAPSSTGHDEERMLRCLREIMDRPGVIPMRIGVNTGKVFTGDFGPPYRRAYRVFGDAINTAARVMTKADAGQILSTAIVLERSRTTFKTTPIEPFRAKGKANLVHASIVGPITGVRAGRRAETPLIGRDAELGALLEVVRDVRNGNGWIVEISGEPGLGRSRLVEELISRSDDFSVLHAQCEEYEALTPYFALRAPVLAVLGLTHLAGADEIEERLRAVVSEVDPALEPWAPLLGVLVGLDLPPTPETERLDERFFREVLADAAMRLLAARLTGAPAMLVVEDVQFIDEASTDLLRRLSRAGAGLRQLLVVTHSDPSTTWAPFDDEELRCLAFALGPLRKEDATEIVRLATDDQPLSPDDVDEIASRSAGSTLFLFELLDMVRTAGTTDALPDSVESVIAGDIDRLSPSDRTVLRYASVLGSSFDPTLLVAAIRQDATLDAEIWERLHDLIVPQGNGTMRFKNSLVRDAAYEGLPFKRRRVLHERVGEAIEAMEDASLSERIAALALHFHEARRHEKAWRYCRDAGDRAKSIAANVEAARFYERALRSAAHLKTVTAAERAAVWVELGATRETSGLYDEAFMALQRASKLLRGQPVEEARIQIERAKARMRAAAYTRGIRETSVGLRLLGDLETPEVVRVRAQLRAIRANLRLYQGRAREAITIALDAVEDAQATGNLTALSVAYMALDGSFQMIGEPEKAVHELLAVAIYEQLGETRRLGLCEANLGVQAYADGRWNEATEWYERARAHCLAAGDRTTPALIAANLGEVLCSRGELDAAEHLLREARQSLRAARAIPYALFAEIQLARIMLERGQVEEALARLEEITAEAATLEHALIRLEAATYFAVALRASGSPSAGIDVLAAAVAGAGDEAAMLSVTVDRIHALCLLDLGRCDEAEELLEGALGAALRQGMIYEQLLVRRAQAELKGLGADDSVHGSEELQEIERLLQLLGLDSVSR